MNRSTSLATSALDYPLPDALIAIRPAEPRDQARMLVVRRSGGEVQHRHVHDLLEYLRPGDRMVFNRTRVLPARFEGRRRPGGGRIEGLFLGSIEEGRWRVMLKCNRSPRIGSEIDLGEGTVMRLQGRAAGEDGAWEVNVTPAAPAPEILSRVGQPPVPPYIRRARRERGAPVDDVNDPRWYQTVYADASAEGSVAAPTAGLHFTPELLDRLTVAGIERHHLELHVGVGTFRPIAAESIDEHVMHRESYAVPAETIKALRRDEGRDPGRIIAVGTTTVRTLETIAGPPPPVGPIAGSTDLLIAPPYRFRYVDGLLTNFHLPRSSLLALVAALLGLDRTLELYREAVEREYRFYSYGDAMLILP